MSPSARRFPPRRTPSSARAWAESGRWRARFWSRRGRSAARSTSTPCSAASGRSDEEAVAALDELVEHGLVRQADTADARYEFSHQILRELVYEETSPARRGLLHRRIAASLPRRGETAALTAQQLRLAGEPREAAEEFRIAAEHAASAARPCRRHRSPGYRPGARPTRRRGTSRADRRPAHPRRRLQRRARELRVGSGREPGVAPLAALEQKLGGVHGRRGDWERSEARLAAALDSVPPGDSGLRARIVADLALSLHHSGRTDDAAARAGEAQRAGRGGR